MSGSLLEQNRQAAERSIITLETLHDSKNSQNYCNRQPSLGLTALQLSRCAANPGAAEEGGRHFKQCKLLQQQIRIPIFLLFYD